MRQVRLLALGSDLAESVLLPIRDLGGSPTGSGATGCYYPIILDLLDAAGVSWAIYDMNWDFVPSGNTDNVFVFRLPTLASVNHVFDSAAPRGPNYQAGGAPAPPRDGREDISNLLDLSAF